VKTYGKIPRAKYSAGIDLATGGEMQWAEECEVAARNN